MTTPDQRAQVSSMFDSGMPQRERRGWSRGARLVAGLVAVGALSTLAACGNNPADPNNSKARQFAASTAFGEAVARYGYTSPGIDISGNDISGYKTRYGFVSCPASAQGCKGFAGAIYFSRGKTWTDGQGTYSCTVPGELAAFDADSVAHQLDILRVADSSQTLSAAAAAERPPQHLSSDPFNVVYDSLVWSCFTKGS